MSSRDGCHRAWWRRRQRSTLSAASSTSTSRVIARDSTSRSTGGSTRASAAGSCARLRASRSARCSPTATWPPRQAHPVAVVPPGTRSGRTASRSSSLVTGSSAAAGRSAATRAASSARSTCWSSRAFVDVATAGRSLSERVEVPIETLRREIIPLEGLKRLAALRDQESRRGVHAGRPGRGLGLPEQVLDAGRGDLRLPLRGVEARRRVRKLRHEALCHVTRVLSALVVVEQARVVEHLVLLGCRPDGARAGDGVVADDRDRLEDDLQLAGLDVAFYERRKDLGLEVLAERALHVGEHHHRRGGVGGAEHVALLRNAGELVRGPVSACDTTTGSGRR